MRGPNLKEDGEMQVKYLHAMDKRALAAAANGHEHDWPIRLRASAVSLHPGTVDAEVDPSRLMMFAVGDVPDGLLKTAIQHQSYGVLIHLSAQIKRETTSSCAAISKVLPQRSVGHHLERRISGKDVHSQSQGTPSYGCSKDTVFAVCQSAEEVVSNWRNHSEQRLLESLTMELGQAGVHRFQ